MQDQHHHAAAVGIQLSASLSALGDQPSQLRTQLGCSDVAPSLSLRSDLLVEREVWVGAYTGEMVEHLPPECEKWQSRNLRFAVTALQQIEKPLRQMTAHLDSTRLAVVVGTSTSGISDNEALFTAHFHDQPHAKINHHKQQMNALAKGLRAYLGWQGPAYTISTACSSSAKAFISGQRLLQAGLVDAVLVGGVDTLCRLTLNGFNSLESLSREICQPCGDKRDGINIGEAAGLFLLTRESAPIMLVGVGESMDAWHISAPHPEGVGAAQAMQRALDTAGILPEQIDYLNLHGTATPQNDQMEIKAVRQVFGKQGPQLSSTKHRTGHCLGAAGAIEAFICQHVLLDQSWLPFHQQHTGLDPELNDQRYVMANDHAHTLNYVMSNSFAFGGSNVSLIFGRCLK